MTFLFCILSEQGRLVELSPLVWMRAAHFPCKTEIQTRIIKILVS